MKYKAILLFGAPGSGKGTQGKILGSIPGFQHFACGDVFRSLDLTSPIGMAFLEYSSKGALVPDDITIDLWSQQIEKMVTTGRFKPETDRLILDGIPRNRNQARMLSDRLDIQKVIHLTCSDKQQLYARIKRRALKENRIDDANDETIRQRQVTYENETKPVLDFYGQELIVHIESSQPPHHVTRDILSHID
ncbi:MAG: adenylate kinase [Verrucomicrobia bacterium Tous-C9LFEB]|nr:MAG: adenylate kinase [Verrucomicrobia bacterium Tous-C9LFEB]